MAEEKVPHLSVSEFRGVSVVEFADRKILDELSIAEIGDELNTLVDKAKEAKFLLDFKNVEHLSSAALGMLIKLNTKVTDKGGELKLAEISPQIYEVFKITQLNQIFQIHATAGQAMTSFQAGR